MIAKGGEWETDGTVLILHNDWRMFCLSRFHHCSSDIRPIHRHSLWFDRWRIAVECIRIDCWNNETCPWSPRNKNPSSHIHLRRNNNLWSYFSRGDEWRRCCFAHIEIAFACSSVAYCWMWNNTSWRDVARTRRCWPKQRRWHSSENKSDWPSRQLMAKGCDWDRMICHSRCNLVQCKSMTTFDGYSHRGNKRRNKQLGWLERRIDWDNVCRYRMLDSDRSRPGSDADRRSQSDTSSGSNKHPTSSIVE